MLANRRGRSVGKHFSLQSLFSYFMSFFKATLPKVTHSNGSSEFCVDHRSDYTLDISGNFSYYENKVNLYLRGSLSFFLFFTCAPILATHPVLSPLPTYRSRRPHFYPAHSSQVACVTGRASPQHLFPGLLCLL